MIPMPKTRLKPNVKPEDILAPHNAEVRQLAEHLRRLVHDTVPESEEAAYPTWHGIGYRHPDTGYFCAIFPQDDSVKLGFEYGILLPDPQRLLHGTGKQVRYVHIQDPSNLPGEAIRELLLAATSLPRGRETRQWLARNAARPGQGNDES